MISLTRLNGSPIFVNCDLIKYAEASPDTMLTLIHGEKIVVLESCDEVIDRITAYRVQILRKLPETLPGALNHLNATSAASANAALQHHMEETQQNMAHHTAAAHRHRHQER
jgi:flagellar protein FlbD